MSDYPAQNLLRQRQQMGRAGRRSRYALAVLVADNLPLDQHFVQFPNDIFDKRANDLLIELDNKIILESHLQCAAHEIPLTEEDTAYFGPKLLDACESCLEKDKEGWYVPNYAASLIRMSSLNH